MMMIMETGWIKLHRKIIDTSFYRQPLTMMLFLHLLLKANHQDKKFLWNKKEIVIASGQLVTGRKSLAEETGISQQSIRTALVNLKSTNTITITSTSKYSLISILNWHKYQLHSTSKSTNTSTTNQPATNQQLTTNNKDKNEENDKNTTNVVQKVAYGNPDINELIGYLKEKLELPALDETDKVNRQYCYLLIKKFGDKEKVRVLIDATALNDFWATKITSFKTLYYKAVQIISATRERKGGVTEV